MDLDQGGFGFQRVRTYLGPSLGWVDELVQQSTHITVGGVYIVQPGDNLLLVDVAASVTIQLPDVVKWFQQPAYQPATGFERSITVVDLGGNAGNFNIIVTPFGQQAINNLQQSTIISNARAAIKIVPLIDLSGWAAVIAGQGGGGGGGGGDVFKAGNNTFTGINVFQGPITVPTVTGADNSQNAASTAWVTAKGYLVSASLAPYAPLASPVFTGDPQAPTPSPGDNDTSIATTAFVQAALAGFSGGAPVSAQYILGAASGSLANGRVLTNTATITWDLSTAGQAKANTSAGGGNVSNVGTPTAGQIAQWTTSTTIQGVALSSFGFAPIDSPTFTTTAAAPTPATADNTTKIATTAYVKANLINYQPVGNYQPLNADLTAIGALSGTNTIYYRSGTSTWSPVAYSGLTFSGGVLTVSAGGGNVNNVGTPTVNQIAVWTDATHIQGVTGSLLKSTAAATAPGSPNQGDFWYDLTTGTFSVYINDGNSLQWVQLNGIISTPGNYVLRDTTTNITTGYTFTPANLGNIVAFTINPALGNYQYGNNNAARVWTAPTIDCAVDILVTNVAGAGLPTFSGFTVGANTGDALTTNVGDKFVISIRRIHGFSTYYVRALQ